MAVVGRRTRLPSMRSTPGRHTLLARDRGVEHVDAVPRSKPDLSRSLSTRIRLAACGGAGESHAWRVHCLHDRCPYRCSSYHALLPAGSHELRKPRKRDAARAHASRSAVSWRPTLGWTDLHV